MKAILEFNLPEDREEYYQYMMAPKLAAALWDITHNLRKQCEREAEQNEKKFDGFDITDGVEIVFNHIYRILEENNIDTNELM